MIDFLLFKSIEIRFFQKVLGGLLKRFENGVHAIDACLAERRS